MENKTPLPVEGVDFVFLETQDTEVNNRSPNPVIMLLTQGYKDVIVQYGNIGLLVEEIPPKLKFDFAILNEAAHKKEDLISNANFKNYLGDIIVSTIEDMAKRVTENESGNNNT
jgi:hypothetical protein